MAQSLPSSGSSSQQRDVQQQADAAEEGEDHERHPHDHRVDVEVTTQPAGDAGDLAVGTAAPDPAEVADVVPADTRAGVRRRALAVAVVSGGVVVMASTVRHRGGVHHRGNP